MALLDILKILDSLDGIQTTDPAQKSLAIARINEAAKEIWESDDFPESLEEEVVDLNVDSQVVALPWYVEYLRGWRYFESRTTGELADKRNRYRDGNSSEIWSKRWRSIKHYPLMHDINNASILELTLPAPESEEFSVNIVGTTSNSTKTQETVTFAPGEIVKVSVGNFRDPIFNITKSKPTAYDITVTDVNGNVLARIPNHRVFCHYHLIQILDSESTVLTGTSSSVEILFKKKFNDLVNDYDEFLFGDKYDKAIYWKYKEHSADNTDSAKAYSIKCDQVLGDIAKNSMAETKLNIGFTRNAFFGLPYVSRGYMQQRYAPHP